MRPYTNSLHLYGIILINPMRKLFIHKAKSRRKSFWTLNNSPSKTVQTTGAMHAGNLTCSLASVLTKISNLQRHSKIINATVDNLSMTSLLVKACLRQKFRPPSQLDNLTIKGRSVYRVTVSYLFSVVSSPLNCLCLNLPHISVLVLSFSGTSVVFLEIHESVLLNIKKY